MITVNVLLSSYNGDRYILEQIKSLINQINVEVKIHLRDDGSTDNTLSLLEGFNSIIHIIRGNNIGVVRSFFSLIDSSDESEYYAFCDQDDVWDNDKLSIAVSSLSDFVDEPALYFSNKRIVDENLRIIDNSNKSDHAFTINEVLLTNNATGCTIVFNKQLRDLLRNNYPSNVIMHDHWAYLVCLAVGGHVVYDPVPHMNYRQHTNNVLGANKSLNNLFKYSSFVGKKNVRSNMAKFIVSQFGDLIKGNEKYVLDVFANYRISFKNRIRLIKLELPIIHTWYRKFIFVIQVLFGFM